MLNLKHILRFCSLERRARQLSWSLVPGAIAITALSISALSFASDVVAIPAHTSLVVDTVGVLSNRGKRTLESALRSFQKSVGPQLQVLSVNSTGAEPIDDFAVRVFDAWKLGDRQRQDGVLLVIAKQDRKLWISVGAGLEGELTDLQTKRIIDGVILPRFKQARFEAGVFAGMDAVAFTISGKTLSGSAPPRARRERDRGRSFGGTAIFVFMFLFFQLFMSALGFRSRRGLGRTALLLGTLGGFGSGRGRHYGGGFGGGGFGGGGGGFTSGGGAGGSW